MIIFLTIFFESTQQTNHRGRLKYTFRAYNTHHCTCTHAASSRVIAQSRECTLEYLINEFVPLLVHTSINKAATFDQSTLFLMQKQKSGTGTFIRQSKVHVEMLQISNMVRKTFVTLCDFFLSSQQASKFNLL